MCCEDVWLRELREEPVRVRGSLWEPVRDSVLPQHAQVRQFSAQCICSEIPYVEISSANPSPLTASANTAIMATPFPLSQSFSLCAAGRGCSYISYSMWECQWVVPIPSTAKKAGSSLLIPQRKMLHIYNKLYLLSSLLFQILSIGVTDLRYRYSKKLVQFVN